jgi:hypothetical protein
MIRRCTVCGESFQARGDWMKRCWSCWREGKDHGVRGAAYQRGYRDGLAAARRLDAALLRDLVALVHPDRHPPERFEQANAATAALLAMTNGRRS